MSVLSPSASNTLSWAPLPTDVACHAHDLNQHLEVAFGILDALRTHLEWDPPGLEHVDHLERVLKHMNDLNQGVLKAFRASPYDACHERIDPDHVITRALELAEHVNPKGVSISANLGAGGARLPMFGIHLQQVVFNLLKQAMEAAPPSSGRILVASGIQAHRGRDLARGKRKVLRITIMDNGTGLPDDLHPRIVEGGARIKAGGQDLCLRHARGILGLYGGTLHLYSSQALGTRATLLCPFE